MKYRPLLLLLLLVPFFTSCEKEKPLDVKSSQIYGQWIQTGTQKYWTYHADGTGNRVDRNEFEQDDENNGDFEWTLVGAELRHIFHGRQGNQNIPKYYTITSITANSMKWKDDYSNTLSFSKVTENQ